MSEQKQFFDFDSYLPSEIAAKVESVGVTKAHMQLLPMAMLGVLAGEVFLIEAFGLLGTGISAALLNGLAAALSPSAAGWENRECRDCMVRPTQCAY